MGAPKPPISDTELAILKVLWAKGPGTVREIESRLGRRRPRRAYTTVLTLLSRLRDKGYVAADRSGPAHVFRSIVSRDELLRHGLRALADRLCDGTASPLVQALVRGGRFSPDEIAHFRRLLDELDSKD